MPQMTPMAPMPPLSGVFATPMQGMESLENRNTNYNNTITMNNNSGSFFQIENGMQSNVFGDLGNVFARVDQHSTNTNTTFTVSSINGSKDETLSNTSESSQQEIDTLSSNSSNTNNDNDNVVKKEPKEHKSTHKNKSKSKSKSKSQSKNKTKSKRNGGSTSNSKKSTKVNKKRVLSDCEDEDYIATEESEEEFDEPPKKRRKLGKNKSANGNEKSKKSTKKAKTTKSSTKNKSSKTNKNKRNGNNNSNNNNNKSGGDDESGVHIIPAGHRARRVNGRKFKARPKCTIQQKRKTEAAKRKMSEYLMPNGAYDNSHIVGLVDLDDELNVEGEKFVFKDLADTIDQDWEFPYCKVYSESKGKNVVRCLYPINLKYGREGNIISFDYCNKEIGQKCHWKRHAKEQHLHVPSDVLPVIKCDKCNETFKQKGVYQQHYKAKHQDRKLVCPYCDTCTFFRYGSLKRHVSNKHTRKNLEDLPAEKDCDVIFHDSGKKKK